MDGHRRESGTRNGNKTQSAGLAGGPHDTSPCEEVVLALRNVLAKSKAMAEAQARLDVALGKLKAGQRQGSGEQGTESLADMMVMLGLSKSANGI
jgi:hypothetical protein